MAVTAQSAPVALRHLVGQRPHLTRVFAVTAFVVTAAIRLVGIGPSGDLYVDELIYLDVGRSAALGGFPQFGNSPFFLHPPAYFYIEAGWEKVFGSPSDPVTAVYDMRPVNALFAAGTAALIAVLIIRVTRSRAAAAVGVALFALDPYAIRQNNRVMLETSAMFWILAGVLVLLPLLERTAPKRPMTRAACVGLLFGLALLTKDETALLTLVPLAIAWLFRLVRRRKLLLLTGAVTVAPYLLYFALVVVFGHAGQFWSAKTSGLGRLIGVVQSTGFNAPGAPSLYSRLTAQVSGYGTTYVLLALGPLALFLLVRRTDTAHRFLALLYICAALTLAYALSLGTLEEQALYLLLVPTVVVLAVALPQARRRLARYRPLPRAVARIAGYAGLVAVLTLSGLSYARTRMTADNGYAQLLAYMEAHVPANSAVSEVDGGAAPGITALVLQDRYRVGTWVTGQQRDQADAQYFVVPWKVVDQGYGSVPAAQAHALAAQGTLLFSFQGRTYGQLALYRIPLPSAPAGATPQGSSHAG